MHAGNENRFVEHTGLIFNSKSKKDDYHNNMNVENFQNWFKTQLIPNLEEPSLIYYGQCLITFPTGRTDTV